MRGRALLAAALLAASLAWVAPGVQAAPDQASLAEVYATLKVARQPSDYVLVVDTSGSMRQNGRWTKVQGAVRSLLEALKPDDHVSLVTFGATTRVRFEGTIGKDPLAALRALPSPGGTGTDIGAGIAQGIGQLEAAGAKPAGAIALITDGKVNAVKGSAYATPDSPGWAALRQRADAVAAKHSIAGYAVALTSVTDAALLKQAFPTAEDIPAENIDARFGQLDADLLRFQATELLRPDVAKAVALSLDVDLATLSTSSRTLLATVTVESPYQHLPVVVGPIAATSSGGSQLEVVGLPTTEIPLAPGEKRVLPVTLNVSGSGAGQLRLTAPLTSAWTTVLTKNLGLTLKPEVTVDLPVQVAEPAAPAVNLLPIVAVVAGLAAAALALLGLMLARRSTLMGSIQVTGPSGPHDLLLAGRSQRLTAGNGPDELIVNATAVKGKSPGVRLDARSGSAKTTATLHDGEALTVGDYVLHYTSARSRMIELIEHHGEQTPQ